MRDKLIRLEQEQIFYFVVIGVSGRFVCFRSGAVCVITEGVIVEGTVVCVKSDGAIVERDVVDGN